MNKIKEKQSAFGLLELLLYITIAATLLLAASGFLFVILQSRVKNQTINYVEQEGLLATQLMEQAIRNADLINSPATGASATSSSINTYDATKNPTLFALSTSSRLTIKEGAAATENITSANVIASSLLFENLSYSGTSGTLRFSFVLSHVNPSNKQEYSYSKTFYGTATLR